MTQPFANPTRDPQPKSGSLNPPAWLPLACQAIRNLQDDLAQKLTPSWDPALDPDDPDLPEMFDAAMSPSGSVAQAASPEEHDVSVGAGDDPKADSTSQPRIRLPSGKLIPMLRLVASIGDIPDRDAMLAPGAITMIERVPSDLISTLQRLLPHALPISWTLATAPGRLPKEGRYLMVLNPEPMNSRVTERAMTAFTDDLARAVDMRAPILVLLPEEAKGPAIPQLAPVQRRIYAPLSVDILIAALRATHSATGRIDEAAVRAVLANDAALMDVDALSLSLAMRAPTAKAVAERIAALMDVPRVSTDGPWLEDLHGDTPALRAARQIVRDLRGWKTGAVAWTDLTRTLLLYGPPGTGKSWIARAMGNSAGLSVVSGTFGQWQSAGHLGDMLREMRKTFAEARTKAPSVLIIDEIDAVGSREDRDQHNRSYRTQVINGFLAEMDSISREEGVIVVGTCNHRETIDPAVLRPGRFDMHVNVPLPDADTLFGVFRNCLPDWNEDDLRDLATRAVGCSAADIDAVIRQTRAMARGQKRDMTLNDLRQLFRITHDPSIDRRVALHECGHAIICAALKLGPVRRIFLDRDGGGGTLFTASAKHGVLADMQNRMVQMLAGRAAERLILGDISAGAGGSPDSDLAQATTIATSIQTRYGLGAQGPVWSADPKTMIVIDPDALVRVKRELENAEKRATQILAVHRTLLEEMADALITTRDMDQAEAQNWLARLRPTAPNEDPPTRVVQQSR